MTRKEAIAKCKSIKEYLTAGNPIWSKEEVAEAMTMAIEALQDTRNCILTLFGDCSYNETGCSDCEIKQTIYKALSVDLVRCGECKYAHMTYGGECKYCDNWSLEDPLYLDGDFFCSYGERRNDGF